MGMEADRMVNLELTEKQVVTERDVIVRERMERTDSNPQRLLGEESLASIFRNHRYGIPIIGWQHEIKSLTREIAFDFYNTWYRPNNAIMIVVGDITLAEVLPLAEKHFGSHEPGPIPDRSRVKEPPQRGSKKITYSDKRVQQPVFERTYLVDSQKLNPGDSEALEILADLLAGGSNSRMTHELVIERQLAVNVSAGYWELHDYGLFEIMVTPKRGVSLEVIEAAIDKIMAETLSDNHQFDLEDFEKSKESYLDNATFARDGLDGIGRIIGQALTNLRFDMDKFEKSPERAAMVTFERVLQVAKENIDPSSAVTSWLIPEPAKVVAPEKSKKATVVAAPKEKTNKKAVSR